MQFLGELGIDTQLLLAQIINFGILLWLLNRFLYKPIVKRIEKDEAELKEAQMVKEDLEQEKRKFEQEKEKEIGEVKQRSQRIIKEAEEVAREIKQRARQEAEQERQAVVQQIKKRLAEIDDAKKSKKQSR
jgi:F-type H+-transporting ATPase subunit b